MMKAYIVTMVIAVLIVSNEARPSSGTQCQDCVRSCLEISVLAGGIALWGLALVGGAVALGVSTAPQGDFNQEFSCGTGALSFCCTPEVVSGRLTGANCTLFDIPNAKCSEGKKLFCGTGSQDLVQAPYVLQKWAKDTQIAGAVIFSVASGAAIVTGLIGLFC